MDNDLRALLKARYAQWEERLAQHRKISADAVMAIGIAEAHLQELAFAIEQLPGSEAPIAAAPVEPAKPKEKLPSEAFADLLVEKFGFENLPEMVDDLPADFSKPRNSRTLRSGFAIALQRRNKFRTETNPVPPSSPAEKDPPAADGLGAGTETRDPLALPGFLDRRGQKQTSEAAE
ncbi:MAG TPA: hypothetical protein VG271_13550 [Beijerinckiaceae bacterium]|jgi:hypothetical protein|nr:hypothetical protein [Beijerinckiaceae bacterium]